MRFLAFCPPYASHLRAFSALAGALADREHRVTFLLPDGVEPGFDHAGVGILRTGRDATGRGAIEQSALRTDRLCRLAGRLPGCDAILGDQMEPAGGLLADALGVPLISIACALPLEAAPGIPLPFLGWPYDPSERGLRRNAGGESVARLILRRQNAVISGWADRFGIGRREGLVDCLSPLLTLSQTLPGFDFPRPDGTIVETGPLRGPDARGFPEGIHPDPNRPFIYASLGTLQGHRAGLLRKVVMASRKAGAQVLVTHAGALSAQQARDLGADWVRDRVPQEAVLERADLCITHAGLNTAMEALERGVPMLALPIAYDQPGVAARLVHHGVALRHSRHWATADRLSHSISRLLEEPAFRRNAARFGRAPGVVLAVERIEAVLRPDRRLVAAQ